MFMLAFTDDPSSSRPLLEEFKDVILVVESNLGMILQEKALVPSRHDSSTETTAIIATHTIHPDR